MIGDLIFMKSIGRTVPVLFLFFNRRLTDTQQGYIIYTEVNDMNETSCCEKRKHRAEEEKKALMNRLSRIEGQIRGIRGMVEKDAYCTDILVQASAASAALNSFNKELLASHIRTCVAEDIRKGSTEAVDDLVSTLQKLMK